MTTHDTKTLGADSRLSHAADGLTVVIPAYNEGAWVERAVAAVRRSARAADWDVEIVVVDDGSQDAESLRVLTLVESIDSVRVLHQVNAGRFAARAAGIAEVRTPYVMLLDARVEVDVAALSRIREAVHRDGLEVWNFDVTPGARTPGALFWVGITKVWWRDYFRRPRRVSFGPKDFRRYPKGTSAFFAPVALLRQAIEEFGSLFEDTALASDDTRLLLDVAARTPITLSPEVTCRHHVKAGVRAWCRQCYYRGTTFVDGYLGDSRRAAPMLALVGAGALAAAAVGLAAPRKAAAGVIVGSAAAAGLTRWSGGTLAESFSVGLLSSPFGVMFGAGVVRGLRMATRKPPAGRRGPMTSGPA